MKKLKSLLKWLKPHSLNYTLVITLVIILPYTYSYVPQFIKYVFDNILEKNTDSVNTLPTFIINFYNNFQGLKAILIVSLSLIIFQLSRTMLMFFNGFLKGRIAENVAYDIRLKLYSHIQDLSYSYHNSVDAGDLIQRCTSDIETVKGFLSQNLPDIFFILTSVVSGAIQMAFVDLRIMFLTFACIPITMIASFIYFKKVSKMFDKIEEAEAEMTSVLQESVNGVRVVKAFAKEQYEVERFNQKNEKLKKENVKLSNYMASYWGFSDGFVFLQYATTIGYCIYLAKNGLTTGDLITCISYISMLVYPVRNLGRIISNFSKSTVSNGRINDILKLETEFKVNGNKKPEILGNIKFDNVSFKFDDSEKNLLSNLSFEIKRGETIAIIGKTGSGKSTICNILTRMVEYTQGDIYLDGVVLKDIDKHHLRDNIGLILQDPFLYQKSIYENVKIASESATEEEVYDACRVASIHDDIMDFDEGYKTLVGEKGVTLSGGQKQRIAISRMILLNKPIIIFDDSLSAVDTKTDLHIRNALKNNSNKLTTILITHRITTAKEANKIIVIDEGIIKDIGTHEELSKKEGLYKELWDIQGALEEDFLKMVNQTIQAT